MLEWYIWGEKHTVRDPRREQTPMYTMMFVCPCWGTTKYISTKAAATTIAAYERKAERTRKTIMSQSSPRIEIRLMITLWSLFFSIVYTWFSCKIPNFPYRINITLLWSMEYNCDWPNYTKNTTKYTKGVQFLL